jgi:hypothetical protein
MRTGIRLGDHRRHGGVDVPGFELISAMRRPKGDEIVVGHGPVLSVMRPRCEPTGWRLRALLARIERLTTLARPDSTDSFPSDFSTTICSRDAGADLAGCAQEPATPFSYPLAATPYSSKGQAGITGIISYYKKDLGHGSKKGLHPLIVLGGGKKRSYKFYDAKTTRYTRYTRLPLRRIRGCG